MQSKAVCSSRLMGGAGTTGLTGMNGRPEPNGALRDKYAGGICTQGSGKGRAEDLVEAGTESFPRGATGGARQRD